MQYIKYNSYCVHACMHVRTGTLTVGGKVMYEIHVYAQGQSRRFLLILYLAYRKHYYGYKIVEFVVNTVKYAD